MSTNPRSTLVSRPPICILGVRFDNVTIAQTLELIEQMIATRQPHYAVTANVDFVVQAQHDIELRRIFFDAHLILCDGTPLVWASRLLGNALSERVAGADIVPLLIELSERKGYRVFFLGAAPGSIERAVANVRARHPDLTICGHYSPPFNQLLEMDHEEIRKRVLEAKPDLLFVSLGCPKQEKWVAMNYRALGVPVTIGVGATIDFLAGQVRRAPVWMQRGGVEWIFRLVQEPRRLYRRYGKDIWVFGRRILAQLWHMRQARRTAEAMESQFLGSVYARPSGRAVILPPVLDCSAIGKLTDCFNQIPAAEDCFLDLSNVRLVESTGVAALMKLRQQMASAGRHLIFIAPTLPVRRALEFMRLDGFFDSALDFEQARQIIETRAREREQRVGIETAAAFRALVWHGEIMAMNVEQVWERTRTYIKEAARLRDNSEGADSVVIDLSVVRFIDSSGLGLMVRTKKLARQLELKLQFANLQPAVLNVVQIARLEEFLLDRKREKFAFLSHVRRAPAAESERAAHATAADK